MVPIAYRLSGPTSSASSRWVTANTRCSGSRNATSIARSVCGRPAVMGRLMPGNSTAFRIGMMGRVFDIVDQVGPATAHRNPPERLMSGPTGCADRALVRRRRQLQVVTKLCRATEPASRDTGDLDQRSPDRAVERCQLEAALGHRQRISPALTRERAPGVIEDPGLVVVWSLRRERDRIGQVD